jgi:hypothetical protein
VGRYAVHDRPRDRRRARARRHCREPRRRRLATLDACAKR